MPKKLLLLSVFRLYHVGHRHHISDGSQTVAARARSSQSGEQDVGEVQAITVVAALFSLPLEGTLDVTEVATGQNLDM